MICKYLSSLLASFPATPATTRNEACKIHFRGCSNFAFPWRKLGSAFSPSTLISSKLDWSMLAVSRSVSVLALLASSAFAAPSNDAYEIVGNSGVSAQQVRVSLSWLAYDQHGTSSRQFQPIPRFRSSCSTPIHRQRPNEPLPDRSHALSIVPLSSPSTQRRLLEIGNDEPADSSFNPSQQHSNDIVTEC